MFCKLLEEHFNLYFEAEKVYNAVIVYQTPPTNIGLGQNSYSNQDNEFQNVKMIFNISSPLDRI